MLAGSRSARPAPAAPATLLPALLTSVRDTPSALYSSHSSKCTLLTSTGFAASPSMICRCWPSNPQAKDLIFAAEDPSAEACCHDGGASKAVASLATRSQVACSMVHFLAAMSSQYRLAASCKLLLSKMHLAPQPRAIHRNRPFFVERPCRVQVCGCAFGLG